jgi:hypothetical protein
MRYAKIEKGIVVQVQPNNDIGFIEVTDDVVCGQLQEGDTFVNPPVIPKTYDEERAEAYPPWQEQMDMQYHDLLNNTTTWKDVVAKVKSDNPKPE